MEKSPHPFCRICQSSHRLGAPHAWDKPSGTKEQRLAIADGVLAAKAVEAPKVKGSRRRTKALAGKTRVNEQPETVGEQVEVLRPAPTAAKKRGRPATGFNKTEYQRELMRKKRAAAKAAKAQDS